MLPFCRSLVNPFTPQDTAENELPRKEVSALPVPTGSSEAGMYACDGLLQHA